MAKKKVQEGRDPAVVWAEKVLDEIRSGLIGAQRGFIRFIEGRLWEPLGYESFEKCYIDRLSDITIASQLWPHVVYELLGEGLSDEQVAMAVAGVGPETAAILRGQKDSGVPAEKATTKGQGKRRPASTIFVHVGEEAYATYSAHALSIGRKLNDLTLEIVTSWFEENSQ
jgi:hypothetical protein